MSAPASPATGGPLANPAAGSPAVATAPAAAAVAATLIEVPRAIAAARSILLDAVVQSRAPDGTTALKTESGVVVVRTSQPVAVGSTVAIEIARTGDQLEARLLPAGGGRGGAMRDAGKPLTPPRAPTDSIATGATRSTGFTAVVLGASVTAGATPATATPPVDADAVAAPSRPRVAAAPAGDGGGATRSPTLPLRSPAAAATPGGASPPATPPPAATTSGSSGVQSETAWTPARTTTIDAMRPAATRHEDPMRAPARRDRQAPAAAAAPTPRATAGAPASPTPSSPAVAATRSAATLAAGSTIELRLASPVPAPSGAPARPAQPLPATVVGVLPHGRAIIETPLGRLVAPLPAELAAAPGDTLALEWFPDSLHAPGGGRRPTESPRARAWEAACQAAAALLDSEEPALRAAADRLVPRPGARLAEQLMLFIGRGDGDVARWLGESVVRQLEGGRQSDRLARGENAAARDGQREATAEWRHVSVPLLDGQQLRAIEFHARRRRGGDGTRARDQSRFIVECVHDTLGAIQIDGLLTAGDGRRRLDVILRTHAALPPADRAAIAAVFADACGAIGMQGEIAFQATPRFPDIAADIPSIHRSVVA